MQGYITPVAGNIFYPNSSLLIYNWKYIIFTYLFPGNPSGDGEKYIAGKLGIAEIIKEIVAGKVRKSFGANIVFVNIFIMQHGH